jgi:hypothetical protein
MDPAGRQRRLHLQLSGRCGEPLNPRQHSTPPHWPSRRPLERRVLQNRSRPLPQRFRALGLHLRPSRGLGHLPAIGAARMPNAPGRFFPVSCSMGQRTGLAWPRIFIRAAAVVAGRPGIGQFQGVSRVSSTMHRKGLTETGPPPHPVLRSLRTIRLIGPGTFGCGVNPGLYGPGSAVDFLSGGASSRRGAASTISERNTL